MAKLKEDKKYIYRVYDFSGGLNTSKLAKIKYQLLLIITILGLAGLCGCSSIGKGNINGNSKDFNWELDGNQCAEVEFYPDGKIKSAKIDNKAKPLVEIGNISPKYEAE